MHFGKCNGQILKNSVVCVVCKQISLKQDKVVSRFVLKNKPRAATKNKSLSGL